MHDVGYVLDRVSAGDRVVFGRDPYGQHFVELWRGRLIPRCDKVNCTPQEIQCIKRALLARSSAPVGTPYVT